LFQEIKERIREQNTRDISLLMNNWFGKAFYENYKVFSNNKSFYFRKNTIFLHLSIFNIKTQIIAFLLCLFKMSG